MLICYFRKKIFTVTSQLSREINFKILFRNLERSILRNFAEKNFAYGALWMVSRPVFTNIEWSVGDVGIRKFISSVKVLTIERKISKLISNVKGALRFIQTGCSVMQMCRSVASQSNCWHGHFSHYKYYPTFHINFHTLHSEFHLPYAAIPHFTISLKFGVWGYRCSSELRWQFSSTTQTRTPHTHPRMPEFIHTLLTRKHLRTFWYL